MTRNQTQEAQKLDGLLEQHRRLLAGAGARLARVRPVSADRLHLVEDKSGVRLSGELRALYMQKIIAPGDVLVPIRTGRGPRHFHVVQMDAASECSKHYMTQEQVRRWYSANRDFLAQSEPLRREDPRFHSEKLRHHSWWPIGGTAGGNTLYVDLAPPRGGHRGQVLFDVHDDGGPLHLVAPSIADVLQKANTMLRSKKGRIELGVEEDPEVEAQMSSHAARSAAVAQIERTRLSVTVPRDATVASIPSHLKVRLPAIATEAAMRAAIDGIVWLTAFENRHSPRRLGAYIESEIPEQPIPASPATTKVLDDLERSLGRRLPRSYRLFLQASDGVERFDESFGLLCTAELQSRANSELLADYRRRDPQAEVDGLVIGFSRQSLKMMCIPELRLTDDEANVLMALGSEDRYERFSSFWDFLVGWHGGLLSRVLA